MRRERTVSVLWHHVQSALTRSWALAGCIAKAASPKRRTQLKDTIFMNWRSSFSCSNGIVRAISEGGWTNQGHLKTGATCIGISHPSPDPQFEESKFREKKKSACQRQNARFGLCMDILFAQRYPCRKDSRISVKFNQTDRTFPPSHDLGVRFSSLRPYPKNHSYPCV